VVTETSPRPAPRQPLEVHEVDDLAHALLDTFPELDDDGDLRIGVRTLHELGILNRVPR
jgi:hypothetical protein